MALNLKELIENYLISSGWVKLTDGWTREECRQTIASFSSPTGKIDKVFALDQAIYIQIRHENGNSLRWEKEYFEN